MLCRLNPLLPSPQAVTGRQPSSSILTRLCSELLSGSKIGLRTADPQNFGRLTPQERDEYLR